MSNVQIDQKLVQDAELKATGANLHKIRQALAIYLNWFYLNNRERFQEAENKLREIIRGGAVT